MSTVRFVTLGVVIVAGVGLAATRRANDRLRAALEDWEPEDGVAEIGRIQRALFRSADAWRRVLDADGIRVDTGWMAQPPDGRRVRLYRTTSSFPGDRLSVDRILALLDGGFLDETLWDPDDFKGGEVLGRLALPGLDSAWVARYVSDLGMPPFKRRAFRYLLMRREVEPGDIAPVVDGPIRRQAVVGYRSVAVDRDEAAEVIALQFPSLDRMTETADGLVIWEHIMCFHLGGCFPLWLTNALTRPAAKVLWNEANNMRAHARR